LGLAAWQQDTFIIELLCNNGIITFLKFNKLLGKAALFRRKGRTFRVEPCGNSPVEYLACRLKWLNLGINA
jgi:hypothetical protein